VLCDSAQELGRLARFTQCHEVHDILGVEFGQFHSILAGFSNKVHEGAPPGI